MQAVCADCGAQLREFNGEANYVHLLVNFSPTIAVSRLVSSLKGQPRPSRHQPWPPSDPGPRTSPLTIRGGRIAPGCVCLRTGQRTHAGRRRGLGA